MPWDEAQMRMSALEGVEAGNNLGRALAAQGGKDAFDAWRREVESHIPQEPQKAKGGWERIKGAFPRRKKKVNVDGV